MKRLIITLIFIQLSGICSNEIFSANQITYLENFCNSNLEEDLSPRWGVQLKYFSGLGLTADFVIDKNSYIHSSLSYMILIFPFSISYVRKIGSFFDIYTGLSFWLIPSNERIYLSDPFLNFGARLKVYKNFYFDVGAIYSLDKEFVRDVKENFGLLFIPDIGFTLVLF
ncbi:MAG: hypothetical protein ACPL25_06535 [Ignavibacteria bacterium]